MQKKVHVCPGTGEDGDRGVLKNSVTWDIQAVGKTKKASLGATVRGEEGGGDPPPPMVVSRSNTALPPTNPPKPLRHIMGPETSQKRSTPILMLDFTGTLDPAENSCVGQRGDLGLRHTTHEHSSAPKCPIISLSSKERKQADTACTIAQRTTCSGGPLPSGTALKILDTRKASTKLPSIGSIVRP